MRNAHALTKTFTVRVKFPVRAWWHARAAPAGRRTFKVARRQHSAQVLSTVKAAAAQDVIASPVRPNARARRAAPALFVDRRMSEERSLLHGRQQSSVGIAIRHCGFLSGLRRLGTLASAYLGSCEWLLKIEVLYQEPAPTLYIRVPLHSNDRGCGPCYPRRHHPSSGLSGSLALCEASVCPSV